MDKEYKGYKIEGVGKGKADYYVYTDLCKGCGLCIAKCPMNKAGKNVCNGQRKLVCTRLLRLRQTLKSALLAVSAK